MQKNVRMFLARFTKRWSFDFQKLIEILKFVVYFMQFELLRKIILNERKVKFIDVKSLKDFGRVSKAEWIHESLHCLLIIQNSIDKFAFVLKETGICCNHLTNTYWYRYLCCITFFIRFSGRSSISPVHF